MCFSLWPLCSTFKLTFSRSASFGDNIDFLRAMLAALARAHKVAVFILDDMDAFARRPKQTLLYCLLDALQTSGVQAVVLGTTCRHDCMDLMEKRVKSRFSHRTAVLCPPARAASRLSANAAEAGPSTRAAGPAGSRPASEEGFDGAMDVLKAMLTLPEEFPDKEHASRHNAAVAAAVNAKDALSALDDYISSRPSLHDLANLASAILLETLHSRGAVVPKDAVVRACRAVAAEVDLDIQTTIAGLSVLELGVLIAAYRAASRVGGEAINFEMVDHEFRPYVTSENHVDVYTKGAACKAFERIAAQGLVAPVSGRDAARVGYGRHYTPMYVQVTIEELRKGVEAHGMVPARMKDWLAREGGPATHAVGMV